MRKTKWPKTIKAVIWQETGPEKMMLVYPFRDFAVYGTCDDAYFVVHKNKDNGYIRFAVDKRISSLEVWR